MSQPQSVLDRRSVLRAIGAGAAAGMLGSRSLDVLASPLATQPAGRKKNVLFIAVDDLRPQLNCYGHTQMVTPHLDALAARGTLFERAYCNVPVCGASRASLLTGVRPTRNRFKNYATMADKDLPGVQSLPDFYKARGYQTVSLGKVYHHASDDADGWTQKPWVPPNEGPGWRDYKLEASREQARVGRRKAGPSTEAPDVADNAYQDGKLADRAIAQLNRLKDEPFFLATGFFKPHLPFAAPRRYWDLYQRDDIDLADNPFKPKDCPELALHNWGELRVYSDIPRKGPMPDDKARELIHGYYACVSYIDAQIGRMVATLDKLGLADDTVIVLWGDHGWNLGEHGLWCKHCNFETSLHSPLLFAGAGVPAGGRVSALSEFIDIYPTLAELSGHKPPEHLHGTSLVPLLRDPKAPGKQAVFSRYGVGDSVKTDTHRYTLFVKGDVTEEMLYDHRTDLAETTNIAAEHPKLCKQMRAMLEENANVAKELAS